MSNSTEQLPAELATFTSLSRKTGYWLHEAMLRGPVLVRDRHGEVVLEIRRYQPKPEAVSA